MVVYSSRSISLYCLFLRTNVVWPISWEAVNPLFSLLFGGQKWATAAALSLFFRNPAQTTFGIIAPRLNVNKIDITKCWIIIWAAKHPLNCQGFYGSHIKDAHCSGTEKFDIKVDSDYAKNMNFFVKSLLWIFAPKMLQFFARAPLGPRFSLLSPFVQTFTLYPLSFIHKFNISN